MIDDYKNLQSVGYNIIKNAVNNDKISHAYLIETMGNDYGFDFALAFAKVLLCPYKYFNDAKCGNCNQCKAIDDNNFIELEIIDTEEMWIKKEKIDSLQKNFNFKPIIGKRKVYIINNADRIKDTIANKLLKFIEEPAEGIVAILVTENKEKIIDTIISRCQIISLKTSYKASDLNILKKYDKNMIDDTLNFVKFLEKEKINSIAYTNDLVHSKLKDRIYYIHFFEIMILFYNDIINYILNNELKIFKDYDIEIGNFETKKIANILKKIDIILEFKKYIINNVNLNLLIDKLIINFEKVDKCQL